MPPERKEQRNERIVRLREGSGLSWQGIADRVNDEFSDDDPISRQRAQYIYAREKSQ